MRWFFDLLFFQQIVLIYVAVINVVTFFYFGFDKIKAQFKKSRISEKQLWFLTLLGGSLGALGGMKFFRHKTKKASFQAVFAVILAIQVVLVLWFVTS